MSEKQNYTPIAATSEEVVAAIRRKTALSLPDDPSAAGISAATIRRRFWEAICGADASVLSELKRIINEANEVLGGVVDEAVHYTNNLNLLFGRFDFDAGNNILNPENSENGYYNTTTGEPVAGTNHQRTASPISVEGRGSYFWVRTNVSNANEYICCIQLDGSGAVLKANSITFAGAYTEAKLIDFADGCTQMLVWASGVGSGLSLANICVSTTEIESFEEYRAHQISTLKESALPESLIADVEEATKKAEEAKRKAEVATDITKDITDLKSRFNYVACANILNPENSESGYYAGTAGAAVQKKASSNHTRTITPLSVGGVERVHILANVNGGTDVSDVTVCFVFADEGGFYVSAPSKQVGRILAPQYDYDRYVDVPSGATQLHLWVSGAARGIGVANLCISTVPLEAFEPYTEDLKPATLKLEALPPEAICNDKKPFEGKTIVNFGDSIFGNYRPPVDVSTFLAEHTGATVHNCGFGGCRMAKHGVANFDAFSMYRLATAIVSQDFSVQDAAIVAGKTAATEGTGKLPAYFEKSLALLKSINFNEVDIITIAYGTNDYASNVDTDDATNTHNTDTFGGALRHSIETILNAFPHIRVFVCSQTWRFDMDGSGNFTDDSNTKVNYDGNKLTDFVAKTKEIAKDYQLPFIDNYYSLGLNKFNRSTYFSATDGVHPNETGRRVLAAHIANELF
jgi:lysophospholipase L1-like esterase